jgi:hypothetical protein
MFLTKKNENTAPESGKVTIRGPVCGDRSPNSAQYGTSIAEAATGLWARLHPISISKVEVTARGGREMKVRTAVDSKRSAGSLPRPVVVTPGVVGASHSRTKQALTSEQKRRIETEAEVHEGPGRMPVPQAWEA